MLKNIFKKNKKPEVIKLEPSLSEKYRLDAINSFVSDISKNKIIAMENGLKRNFPKSAIVNKCMENYTTDSKEIFAIDSISANTQAFVNQPIISEDLINWFSAQGFIGYQLCGIFAQHWLVDKACTTPARDAIRNGYETTVNDGQEVPQETLDKIRQFDNEFCINDNCVQFSRMARIFGIRIAMFKIDVEDPIEFYANPFNIDGVTPGSYKGIAQIDPYWITPQLDADASADPSSIHFYEPTWWRVNNMVIHRSHLIINIPYPLPDILKPSYLYGGISLCQKIYERVYAAERCANEAPLLTMTKRLNIMSTDVTAVTANPAAFQSRLTMLNYFRDNFGILTKDKDNEDFIQLETSLADLDAVIMTQYQIVAAIANVPVSKLMGISLKGFNATGEYEEKSYHEELKSIQSSELTPLIQRHHQLIIKSHIAPQNPFDTTIVWNPLNIPTDEEIALLNKAKAETAVALSTLGAIDGQDERDRIINDPKSGYNGLEPKDESDFDDEEEIEVKSNVNDPYEE